MTVYVPLGRGANDAFPEPEPWNGSPGEGGRVSRRSRHSVRRVWCRDCQRDDESCNQNACRHCGSEHIEKHGG